MVAKLARSSLCGVLNIYRDVRQCGATRRRVERTHSGTLRTSGLGSTFLTGVDRRVQAPLGTVMNFSSLLDSADNFAKRRVTRFVKAVGGGYNLLLTLVGSVLSLSHVRSKAVRFVFTRRGLSLLLGAIRSSRQLGVPPKMRLVLHVPRDSGGCLAASGIHLRRIIGGLVGGTTGFADDNFVAFNCRSSRSPKCAHVFMRSAKMNVSRRNVHRVFRQFCGISGFARKTNLKLDVYRAVVRQLGNIVSIASRMNGKAQFAIHLPGCYR